MIIAVNEHCLTNSGTSGTPADPPNQLGDSISAVLSHIRRYRLTVFSAVEQLAVLQGAGPRHIKHILKVATRENLIDSARLHHNCRYWFLTETGVAAIEGNCRHGPLTEPAKVRAFATLAFCHLSDRPRVRLMRDELCRHFPDLDETGMTSTYYFDGAGSGCLGLARVDAGQRGRWDRVVESIREDIDTHCNRRGFQKLIADRSFEISILTVHPQKAARIRQALSEKSDAQRIPIRIVPILQLLPLLTFHAERL